MHKNMEIIDGYGSGNSYLVLNVLPDELIENAFETTRDTTEWYEMKHKGGPVPRLVSIQTTSAVDTIMNSNAKCCIDQHQEPMIEMERPIYRHPIDEEPPSCDFTPIVRSIKEHAEHIVSQIIESNMSRNHIASAMSSETEKSTGMTSEVLTPSNACTLNHALVQWYRSGNDNIREHSDKTLDIAMRSWICNISLGATRTLYLKSKRKRREGDNHKFKFIDMKSPSKYIVQKVKLPHNSMFVMDGRTNLDFSHAIKPDKRLVHDKTKDELLFDSNRISITLRTIATFQKAMFCQSKFANNVSKECTYPFLYGQGSIYKSNIELMHVLQSLSPCVHCAVSKLEEKLKSNETVESGIKIRNSQEQQMELLKSFRAENHSISKAEWNEVHEFEPDLEAFDWEEHYGIGFTISNTNCTSL